MLPVYGFLVAFILIGVCALVYYGWRCVVGLCGAIFRAKARVDDDHEYGLIQRSDDK